MQQQAMQLDMAGKAAQVDKTQAEAEAKRADTAVKVQQAAAPVVMQQ
jgi:hypothetical protein